MVWHGLTSHRIKQVEGGTRGNSWWISFAVDDEKGFCGQVLHIHAETPEAWRVVVQDYLTWLGTAAGAAGALGLGLGPAAAVPAVASAAWKGASNRDGTYDFYVIVESRDKRSWWKVAAAAGTAGALGLSLGPAAVPAVAVAAGLYRPWLNFKGFVSDQAHKPPIGTGLGHIAYILPSRVPRIRAIANEFRYQPKPQ
jgi:hypothetical protein